jgi:putative hemolysin
MIRLAALLSAGLLIAACQPMPAAPAASDQTPSTETAQAPAAQTPDAAACAARGGEIRRVGRLQSEQCVILYADAGKACTDGDQCQGDCRIEGNAPVKDPDNASGFCTADSNRFGCHTTVEDGKAGPTLCID